MKFEMIDDPNPNFPVNIFTPDEDTVEVNASNRIAISCCMYVIWPLSIDSISETDADE